jgi:CrcB protein
MTAQFGEAFPWHTLFINVSGSLLIGVLMAVITAREPDPFWRLLSVVGFLGGYTTFSSFSYETVGLIQTGEWGRAASYVLLSNLLAVGATFIGLQGGRLLVR